MSEANQRARTARWPNTEPNVALGGDSAVAFFTGWSIGSPLHLALPLLQIAPGDPTNVHSPRRLKRIGGQVKLAIDIVRVGAHGADSQIMPPGDINQAVALGHLTQLPHLMRR